MTKTDIIAEISNKTGITKPATAAIVEELMESVRQTLVKGENVYMRGFGTFGIKRKALRHFNYAPGKMRIIPEHSEPSFKPCAELKEAVKKTPLK